MMQRFKIVNSAEVAMTIAPTSSLIIAPPKQVVCETHGELDEFKMTYWADDYVEAASISICEQCFKDDFDFIEARYPVKALAE